MKKTTCPFLGLREDPSTALNFPSEGNACHRANPIAPVDTAHQEQFCLGPGYKACPIYQAAAAQPVPAMFAAPSFWINRRKRRLAIIAIPFVAAGVVVLGITFNGLIGKYGLLGASRIPQTGASNQSSALGLFGDQPARPLLNTPAAKSTATLQPTCARPEGWVPYTVNPTDSLFRLSAVYGVSVDALQQGNCMGKDTVILPGQVIYIPFLPSPTPSATPTPTPTFLLPTDTNTAIFVAPTTANQAQDKPAPRPQPSATPQPPVKPANTPVPPSKPVQQPTAKPPEVKPTEKPKPPEVKPTEKPKPPDQPKPAKTEKPKGGGDNKGGKGGGKGGGGGKKP